MCGSSKHPQIPFQFRPPTFMSHRESSWQGCKILLKILPKCHKNLCENNYSSNVAVISFVHVHVHYFTVGYYFSINFTNLWINSHMNTLAPLGNVSQFPPPPPQPHPHNFQSPSMGGGGDEYFLEPHNTQS